MSLFLGDDPVNVLGCVVFPAEAGLNSASFLFSTGESWNDISTNGRIVFIWFDLH